LVALNDVTVAPYHMQLNPPSFPSEFSPMLQDKVWNGTGYEAAYRLVNCVWEACVNSTHNWIRDVLLYRNLVSLPGMTVRCL